MNLEDFKCVEDNIDIDEYIKFREYVKSHMEHPEWLGNFTKEEIEYMLNHNSKIWIYYDGKVPVCSMMEIPSRQKDLDKFGIDLDYDEVVDYGPIFVSPKYVGNSLQYKMLKVEDEYCINLGYKYAATTIHPDNIYCIRNMLKDNFEYKNTREFTRGIRNIYLKKF